MSLSSCANLKIDTVWLIFQISSIFILREKNKVMNSVFFSTKYLLLLAISTHNLDPSLALKVLGYEISNKIRPSR